MRAHDFINELYDPEGKYTGGGQRPPPPPPRKGGGPDWEDGGNNSLWREFFTLMREKLIERDFKILYPREPDETALLLDANWPASMWAEQHLGAMRIWFDVNPDDTATLHILAWKAGMLPEKPVGQAVVGAEVEPWENRKLRIRITDFEFALRKIATIQQIVISSRFKPTNESVLTEGATDILYHYTSSLRAKKILADGVFKLSSTIGTPSEAQYAPRGYQYFLSTTRSKVGDYHRYSTNGATMFVLDGRWLGQRYPVKPIDYWDQSWVQTSSGRTRESEDRVFSRDNTIPITPVKSIHVLVLGKEKFDLTFELNNAEKRWKEIAQIIKSANELQIPVYAYYNVGEWRTQNTAKAVDPNSMPELQPTRYPVEPVRELDWNYLDRWIELLEKQPGDELSRDADRARQSVLYYSDSGAQLATDMHNARKPDVGKDYESAVKIIAFMRKNRLKSVSDIIDYLKNKWSSHARK